MYTKTTCARYSLVPYLLMLFFFLAGCSAPLHVSYDYSKGDDVLRNRAGDTPPILVRAFTDARRTPTDESDPRVIGTISATTQDIYGKRLVLDSTPSLLVTESLRRFLDEEGFSVLEERATGGSTFSRSGGVE